MLIVHVHVHVKPESADAFAAASLENARNSVQEPGVVRFDVIRQADDPTRFVRREPLRRVHECVFGVLALESEPVDPRL